MASRVPIPYCAAPELCVDSRAILSLAKMVWDQLTEHEHEALRASAYSKSMTPRVDSGRTAARARLAARGITTPTGFLTPLGLLVREAGLKMTAEWQPKRRESAA